MAAKTQSPYHSALKNGDGMKHSSITLHAHGDGTYHSHPGMPGMMGDGERTEHPHIGHALMHIARMHSTGDHMHVHDDGDGYTTHHSMDGGKVKGPHEHDDMEALHSHIAQVFNEEAGEPGGKEEDEEYE